jgi:hypothetical protein
MSTVFVVPATDLLIPNFDAGPGQYISPAGETVTLTPEIQRLIDAGDLIISTPAGPHWSEIIMSEANGTLSRDTITVKTGSGVLVAGMVMGMETATGKWKPSPDTGSDGTQIAGAILLYPVDATASDVVTTALTNLAEVNAAKLSYDASVSDNAKKTAKNNQLKAVLIKVRS